MKDDFEEPGFLRRYGLALGVVTIAVVGSVTWLVQTVRGPARPAPKPPEFSMVRVALPTPPPPPPQQKRPEEVAPEQRDMIAQEEITPEEEQPEESPPEKEPEAPAGPSMGTNLQSDGPADAFGLVGRGGGGFVGRGGAGAGTGSGRGGSRWGWYASRVQSQVEEALRTHEKTRAATLRIDVRLWPDDLGRITHAQLLGSTGDPAIDEALQREVLTGLLLREPPPSDMPRPIVMRITARQPN